MDDDDYAEFLQWKQWRASRERAPKVEAPPVPTLRELWDQWEPWAARSISSWATCLVIKKALLNTPFPLDTGEVTSLGETPWNKASRHVANKYRGAREAMPNRRGGLISPTTVNRELDTLQSMLNYHLKIKGSIDHNPILGWSRTDEAPYARQTSLTPDQVEKFLEGAHPMFQDIARVAYRCVGMRNSEARLLRKAEVDWDRAVINLPAARNKSRRARVVPIPDDVLPILRRHADVSRGVYVFVMYTDPKRERCIGKTTFHYWLEAARKASGIVGFNGEKIVMHTMRHSAVTELTSKGAPERYIKAAAGMCDKTFRRYSQFNPDQQDILREFQNGHPITDETDRKAPRRVGVIPDMSAAQKSTIRKK